MPANKITCPECEAVLKTANPITPGKKVKCPKCGASFRAPDEEDNGAAQQASSKRGKEAPDEDEDDAPAKKKSSRGKSAGKKKSDAKEDSGSSRPAGGGGDGDDVGTYGLADEEPLDDDREAAREEATLAYFRPNKSTDPRGPAQAALVGPSNYLIATGALGFFGWLAVLLLFLIPIIFPARVAGEPEEGEEPPVQQQQDDEDKPNTEKTDEATDELYGTVGSIVESMLFLALFIFVLSLGLVQGGLIAYGAVKMQTLESHAWGMATSIIAMFPLHGVPVWALITVVLGCCCCGYLALIVSTWVLLWGPFYGTRCLLLLMRDDIKAAFEYKPEY